MLDSIGKGDGSLDILSTTIIPTTGFIPSMNNSDLRNGNGTMIKRTFKKGSKNKKKQKHHLLFLCIEILIGIIAGVVVLLISIITGIVIFILLKR